MQSHARAWVRVAASLDDHQRERQGNDFKPNRVDKETTLSQIDQNATVPVTTVVLSCKRHREGELLGFEKIAGRELLGFKKIA